jgi:hypothetical protein
MRQRAKGRVFDGPGVCPSFPPAGLPRLVQLTAETRSPGREELESHRRSKPSGGVLPGRAHRCPTGVTCRAGTDLKSPTWAGGPRSTRHGPCDLQDETLSSNALPRSPRGAQIHMVDPIMALQGEIASCARPGLFSSARARRRPIPGSTRSRRGLRKPRPL